MVAYWNAYSGPLIIMNDDAVLAYAQLDYLRKNGYPSFKSEREVHAYAEQQGWPRREGAGKPRSFINCRGIFAADGRVCAGYRSRPANPEARPASGLGLGRVITRRKGESARPDRATAPLVRRASGAGQHWAGLERAIAAADRPKTWGAAVAACPPVLLAGGRGSARICCPWR